MRAIVRMAVAPAMPMATTRWSQRTGRFDRVGVDQDRERNEVVVAVTVTAAWRTCRGSLLAAQGCLFGTPG